MDKISQDSVILISADNKVSNGVERPEMEDVDESIR